MADRAQSQIRHTLAVRAARNSPPPPHNPFDDTSWWQDYWTDHIAQAHLVWEPYLYVRNPTYRGKTITIDSAGHRITPIAASPAPKAIKVFFLGGSTGRVITQEVIELMLQLRAGVRPDIVVFYDGINEVVAAVQNARPGVPQNEETRRDDFIGGREIVAGKNPGLANDRKWAARILAILADRIQFVRSIARHTKPAKQRR